MVHSVTLVVVPKNIVENKGKGRSCGIVDKVLNFVNGQKNDRYNNLVEDYVRETLAPFSENIEMKPYIYKTKARVDEDVKKYKEEHPDEETFDIWNVYHCNPKFDYNGNFMSTNNPNSLYDWYEIGGRWGDMYEGNIVKISDLIDEYQTDGQTYSVIVDKEGKIKTSYEWLHVETVVDDKSWPDVYLKTLEDAKDDYAVIVDCHI